MNLSKNEIFQNKVIALSTAVTNTEAVSYQI